MRRGRHRRRRRRDRRGPGVDRRKRHHGRIGPGDPRGGRRQKLRHGRHEGPLRPHSRESHRTARREFPRPDDRPGRRLLAPEDAQRNRADDPAGRVHARFRHRLRHAQALRRLCGGQYHRRGVHLAVRLPDPDHHRRPAVGHRHRRHGPRPAGQRHHQVGQGRRDRRRHRHAAPGQDRHHHHRQPQGHALPSRRRHRPQGFRAHVRALVRRRPDPRRQIRRRAGHRRRGPHRPGDDGRRADGEIHRRNQVFGRRHARRTPHPQGSRRSNLPHRRRARKPLPGRNRSHRAHHLRKRRHTARSLRKRTDHGRHRVAGHHQDGHPRTLRAAAPDGREDRDGHGRQSADGQIHRREGRRRRLHRRSTSRGQARIHPPRTAVGQAGGHDGRRHERRPGAGAGRRGRGHEQRHAGRQGGGQHGRPGQRPHEADRDRRDRQTAADDARHAHDLLHRQRRREVLRHRPGAVHRLDSVARRAERHAPPLARKRHSLGGDLQRPDHSAAHPAGPARRDLQTDRGLGPAAPQPLYLRTRRRDRPVRRHQTDRHVNKRIILKHCFNYEKPLDFTQNNAGDVYRARRGICPRAARHLGRRRSQRRRGRRGDARRTGRRRGERGAAVHRCPLFLEPSLGRGLQRRRFGRQQQGHDQPRAPRRGGTARAGLSRGASLPLACGGSRRNGHGQRLGPRPRHLAPRGAGAGAPRGRGTRAGHRYGTASGRLADPKTMAGAFRHGEGQRAAPERRFGRTERKLIANHENR